MTHEKKPLVLVDGSSYLYRAFHALPALMNSKGFPTGAVYGVINMLKRLITDYQPEYLVVVFDAKGKTFRDDLYAEYKATRKEMPADLAKQIEPIHKLIAAMGLPIVMLDGVEADDVIGTLAKLATAEGLHTVISTGDKDLAQLVNEQVTLINTMSNSILNINTVNEKFGVPPERIVDYLALMGDTSDNIPGVPQVGPKTAVKWLQAYGSLDEIIANKDKISGKVGENFRAFIPQLPLTKSLVTIKCDVDVALDLPAFKLRARDEQAVISLFKEMEFKTWLAEALSKTPDVVAEAENSKYTLINTEEELDKWCAAIQKAALFAFNMETTSVDYMQANIVGVSFAYEAGSAAYVPFAHDFYMGAPTQLTKEEVWKKLKPMLENPSIKKIGQNIKYDLEVLANHGVHMQGIAYDTMMESYVLDSAGNTHNMDALALKYLGVRTMAFSDIAGTGRNQLMFNQISIDKACEYVAEDTDITLRLHQYLWPRVKEQSGLKNVFENIEMPLIPVLAQMELTGVLIDPELLRIQGIELGKRLDELESQAYLLAGESFNINSPKQLQDILFNKLHIPVMQKTPTGQASTADAVLQELAHEYELPKIIIEYRSLSKLISTYTNRLVEQMNVKTGRIHTSYNQTGAATGRLSSSEPNLQNIPIRSVEGRRIRRAFIAPQNHKLISADYSQIELRLMAHISQDKSLLYAFMNDLDIHRATASEVWSVPLDQVTSEMRRNAKAINFGLIYGMSAFGLAKQIGVDRHAAQDYINRYFARYPKVHDYMESTRENAKKLGYVETLWGRRLYLPDINASQIPRQRAAERTAINAPLQGSAADMIKMAMVSISHALYDSKSKSKMIMQVHDELVFEVPEDEMEQTTKLVREHMANVVKLDVPVLVSVGVGENWDEASDH